MNLQDIAKKEAEERYKKHDNADSQHLPSFTYNELIEARQEVFMEATAFCLNTLARSEGDVSIDEDYVRELVSNCTYEDGGINQIGIRNELKFLLDKIKEHTASAVAKAVGENEEHTRNMIVLFDEWRNRGDYRKCTEWQRMFTEQDEISISELYTVFLSTITHTTK